MPGFQQLEVRMDASGFYGPNGVSLPATQRNYGAQTSAPIIVTGAQEISVVLVNGTNTTQIDLEYQLYPNGAWANYQANMTTTTRYTHLTTDNIFYNQANQTFLPVHAIRFSGDSGAGALAAPNGTGTAWVTVRYR